MWVCFSVPILERFCQQSGEGGAVEGKEIPDIKKKKKKKSLMRLYLLFAHLTGNNE